MEARHVVVILAGALALCSLARGSAGATEVSIVSYNMMHFQGVRPGGEPPWNVWADTEWYPNPNKPGYFEFFTDVFRSLDADIIALQESVVPEHDAADDEHGGHGEMRTVPELARRLNMHYFIQEKSRFHGFAVLSRFPIVEGKDLSHGGTPGVGIIRVTIRLDDGALLHVYDTHLHWQDPAIRAQELDYNRKVIADEGLAPQVYVGDFNIYPADNPELNPVRESGYEGFGHGVDYVWVKKGGDVRIVAFAPVENERTSPALSAGEPVGSDHLPVKAVLRIGDGPITMDERRAALRKIVGLKDVPDEPADARQEHLLGIYRTYEQLLRDTYGGE